MRMGWAPVPAERGLVLCPCVLTLPVCLQHPTDVDYRVMATFTEFYTTLLGFVNFRLYHSLNLLYPPKVRPPPAPGTRRAGPSLVAPPGAGGGKRDRVGGSGLGLGWGVVRGLWVWELPPHLSLSAQIDGQADVELKPAEGKEYAMDSESYLEVRDAAVTLAHGRTLRGCGVLIPDSLLAWGTQRAGAEEQSLIPAWWRGLVPNSLPPHAGQGRSFAWPRGPLDCRLGQHTEEAEHLCSPRGEVF